MGFFEKYAKVARLEYIPAEGPAILAPLALGIAKSGGLALFRALEGASVFILLFFAGFIINAMTDIEVDKKYKVYVAESSTALGKRTLALLVLGQTAAALAITIHLAWVLDAWWLVAFVMVGIFFGLGYSVPPFHFKVRGIWHPIALSLSAFFIPILFLFYVVAGEMDPWIVMVFAGLAVTHYGLALTNQCGDYLEDKETGMATPGVRWGLRRTLRLALGLMIVGVPFTLTGLSMFSIQVPIMQNTVSIVGLNVPLWEIVVGAVAISLLLGYSVSIRGIGDLLWISGDGEPDHRVMEGIKRRMNYPIWQAASVWGAVVAAILVSSIVLLSPSLPQGLNDVGQEVYTGEPSFAVSVEDITYTHEDNGSLWAVISANVSSDSDVIPGSILLRARSLFAGRVLDEESSVLDVELSEGKSWNPSVRLVCHEEGDTTFDVSLVSVEDTLDTGADGEGGAANETVLWTERIWCSQGVYISSAAYKITASSAGAGQVGFNQRANVTVEVYAARGIYTPGSLEIVVRSSTTLGALLDEETAGLEEVLRQGDVWTASVCVDVNDLNPDSFVLDVFLEEGGGAIIDSQQVA
ncbi:MAG: UbiA family prenyltransferase [Thermoplasmata archaeon]|nr:UbiA family prenyltransferase [Thermoplasmata archaeon]